MDAKQQIKDKLYSLLSDGVKFFPNFAQQEIESPQIQKEVNTNSIASCTRCPLSRSRQKVVVSQSNLMIPKKFFILSDFPQKEDENSDTVFSPQSSTQLLVNLVQRLGVLEHSYFSFSLKCVPEKGIPEHALSLCAQHNLSYELEKVRPEVIFCFGHRSLSALLYLDPSLKSESLVENQTYSFFHFQNSKSQLYFLSSSRDLQEFPPWRTQVWNALKCFSAQNR